MLTYNDYKQYPEATDYYDVCEFYYVEPDIEGIITLANLGDVFIMEPTGPYSKPWHDNLLKRGKEVRLVAHDKLRSFALHKGFKSKDDEQDAVALAYYGWEYLDNLIKFNRIRDPRLQKIYLGRTSNREA